jgi:hypothetical protein
MPFPFLPIGAIVAVTVLVSSFAAFYVAVMAIDKTATRVFGGVVTGVVAGARRWRDETLHEVRTSSGTPEPVEPIQTDRVRHRMR